MKLTKIDVKDFIGVKKITINLDTPITLISGKNASGKSSLQEAIRMAIFGVSERVIQEKAYPQLVNNQSVDGIGIATIDTDLGGGAITLPKGVHACNIIPTPALEFVLDATRFTSLLTQERRAFLTGLFDINMEPDEIEKRLASRDLSSEKIKQTMPLLRAGFEIAHKEAKDLATQAKGAWKQITGETWGIKKAESWEAKTSIIVNETELKQAEGELKQAEAALGEAQRDLGEKQALKKNSIQNESLRQQAEQRDQIKQKLEDDEKELAEWDHGIATIRASKGVKCTCPDCGTVLLYADEQLYSFDPSKTANNDQLENYQKSRDLKAKEVEAGKRNLVLAESAQEQLEKLNNAEIYIPDDIQLEQCEHKVTTAQTEYKQKQQALQKLRDILRIASESENKTKEASMRHKDVIEWTAIAEALSPDGIQNEILSEALTPFNDLLAEYSNLAEWENISINKEMVLTFGDRPYNLLSESEKWRVDCIVTLTISQIADLGVIMLDRMDVLDMPSRASLLKMLHILASRNQLNTAIVCATLKAKPNGYPPTITNYWLESGELS